MPLISVSENVSFDYCLNVLLMIRVNAYLSTCTRIQTIRFISWECISQHFFLHSGPAVDRAAPVARGVRMWLQSPWTGVSSGPLLQFSKCDFTLLTNPAHVIRWLNLYNTSYICHKFSWQVFMVYFEYFFNFLSKIPQTHLWYQIIRWKLSTPFGH